MARPLPALLLLLCACAGERQLAPAVDLDRVWHLMDRRDASADLVTAALAGDPELRELAVRALGRVPLTAGAGAAKALESALADESPAVRREAAFALGQVQIGAPLLRALADPDPELRELAASALGKCKDAGFVTSLLPLLSDRVRGVRGAAALAILRLLGDRLRRPETATSAERSRVAQTLITLLAKESDETVRWRQVYALAHLVDNAAEATLIAALSRGARSERIFAARGLSALALGPAGQSALLAALVDPEPGVVVEAMTALASPERQTDPGRRKSAGTTYDAALVARALGPLATDHSSRMVRAKALELLGRCGAAATFPPRPDDPSLAAAWVAGRIRAGQIPEESARATADWRERLACARTLPTGHPGLQRLLEDPDLRVRAAVLETPVRLGERAVPLVVQALATRDLLIRETLAESVLTLESQDPRLVLALKDAFADSPGLEFAEARKLLLHAIATLAEATPETRAFVRLALRDPDLVVRREAATLARSLGESLPAGCPGQQAGLITPLRAALLPLERLTTRPRIVLETPRGTVELTLRPDLAPVHCWNLIQLVESGAYRGRIFHRVVPNFVVQGGDHRGDGSGARAWNGGQLRDEINPLGFDTGTLGMPKTADPDTGGDQIFVTTVPTPHLDGRYTAFGTVTQGLAALEELAIGDVILAATVVRD